MGRRRRSSPDVLARLSPAEGLAVLRALLTAHPELVAEARQIATRQLVTVDRSAVADGVVDSVGCLGFDELNSRAGPSGFGYIGSVDAAIELLDEAVEPMVAEIARLDDLGLPDAAQAQCEGVLLGLYRIERELSDNPVLLEAIDFPCQTAAFVLSQWRGAAGRARELDPTFIREQLPEWIGLVPGLMLGG